jgi:hypothetical protein
MNQRLATSTTARCGNFIVTATLQPVRGALLIEVQDFVEWQAASLMLVDKSAVAAFWMFLVT